MRECLIVRKGVVVLLCLMPLSGEVVRADEPIFDFDIPEQRADDALILLGEQADATVLFQYDMATQHDANRLQGEYTLPEAVDILLADSGLKADFGEQGHLYISIDEAQREGDDMNIEKKAGVLAAFAAVFAGANAQEPEVHDQATAADEPRLEEIIVVGTNIRGHYPDSSPVQMYTADDIRATGAITAEQFLARLPENHASLSGSSPGANGLESNTRAIAGIDLRGLGVGTTLVLVNGRRLAPASSGRTPDISMLPLGVIERVEILTDGASAIYGADAVAGVVNFVLSSNYDSAETVVSYGSVTSGSHEESRAEQSFGKNWSSGSALLSGTYFKRTDLKSSDRSFAGADPFTLIPSDQRISIVATGHQNAGENSTAFADVLYSQRTNETVGETITSSAGATSRTNDSEQFFATLGVNSKLLGRIDTELLVSYSRYDRESKGVNDASFLESHSDSTVLDATIKASGSILSLAAGDLRFAFGGGYTEETYESSASTVDMDSGIRMDGSTGDLGRDSKYLFAELVTPLLGPSQNLPLAHRLEFTLAARYTDYSDFGGETVPKYGLLWLPNKSVSVRATYGESFRAPTLVTSDPFVATYDMYPWSIFAAAGIPDPFTADGSSVLFWIFGGPVPTLRPEKSDAYTIGVDLEPEAIPNLRLSTTYFNIEYTDQVGLPDPTGGINALLNPASFPELFVLDPSSEDVATRTDYGQSRLNLTAADPSDPESISSIVTVLLDTRSRNLSRSKIDGIDLAVDHSIEEDGWLWRYGLQGSYIFDSTQQLDIDSPVISLVDSVGSPASLRARAYVGVANNGLTSQINFNYIDEYQNPFSDSSDEVSSWFTIDLAAAYDFGESHRSSILRSLVFNLSIINLLDRDPPFVPLGTSRNTSLNASVGYDPANASPLGRFITLGITKRW